MRDKVKRFISILMTALMLVNLLPVGALAEGMKLDSNSVQSRASKKSANVYVYVKVTGDKAGLTINPSGWYTIGKSENVPGMGTPYWFMHGSHSFSDVGVSYKTVLKTNFTRWTDNQKIDLDQITWTEFYVDNGADDYVKAGTYTWHMNGTIDIKHLPSVYTIKYVDYDTKELIHSYEKTGLMGQTPEKVTAPDSLQENLYSFYFVNGHPKEQTVDFKKDKGELTFYYKKNTAAYTVNYYLNGTKTKVAEPKKRTAALGKSVTESPITVEGYTPVSNDSQTITIKANSDKNVINFYYYKNVTLTANSDTATYDGKEHSVSGFTGAPDGADFRAITVGAAGTNVGTYTAAFADGTVDTVDATEKYIVTAANPGTLTINPIDEVVVTITGHNDTVPYDGDEHTVTGYDVSISNDLYKEGDFTFSGTAEAKGTNAGTYQMGLKADQFTNNNDNFKKVTFVVNDGTLTINPVDEVVVTITGHNDTVPYDGDEHTVTGYDVSISNDLYKESDFTFTGTAEAKGTDAGTYQMGLKADQFTNNNDNFTNVTFNVTDGWLKINPVETEVVVKIAGNTKTETYNGKEHNVEGYTVTSISNGLYKATDIAFTGEAKATGTNAGTYPMNLKAEQFSNTSKNFSKVTFEVADGWLKIDPVETEVFVKIAGNTKTETYNGKEHNVEGYTVTSISNPLYKEGDFSFSGDDSVSGINAGKYDMELKASDFANTNANFSKVTFVIEDGQLVIEKRKVTLTSASDSKVYDGTPLTKKEVTVGGDGFAKDEGVTYTFKGSQTNAGSSKNMFTYAWNEGTNKDNYTIYQIEGDLVVTPIDGIKVTITGHKDTQTYDGKPHKVEGYDVKPDNPLFTEKDIEFNGEAEATGTDVRIDPYQMGLKPEQFTNTSNNFTNVEFVVEDGQIVITPRAVTLTSETAGKTYDGTPLTRPNVTVSTGENDGFVEGQVTEIKATGSVTNAGSVANTITFTPNKETFKEGNYAITKTEGTLTIAKRSVLITSQSATKTYDGSALTRPAVTITGDGFVPGELAKAEATGSITYVGSTPNAIRYTTTGAFNAANYSIALSVGTLTVTEKPKPEPRRTFNLTINYVYQNGKRAAASYNRGGLKNGETFDITSPVIAGYTASETVVSGTIYNRDIKVTVIYTADGVNLDDYGVPLGLGNITMNVGDCFE